MRCVTGDTGRPTPVHGESIWSQPPTPRATASLVGRDEYVTLPELLELAVANGFAPLQVHEASRDEWDTFESGYSAAYARWLADHDADHEDRGEVKQRARASTGRLLQRVPRRTRVRLPRTRRRLTPTAGTKSRYHPVDAWPIVDVVPVDDPHSATRSRLPLTSAADRMTFGLRDELSCIGRAADVWTAPTRCDMLIR